MILQELHQLYDRLERDPGYDVARPGWSYQKVSLVVVIEHDGSLVSIQDARHVFDGRTIPRRLLVPGSAKPSGSGLNPCFLWDSPGYLLGWDPDKPERAAAAHEAFRSRHLGAEGAIACDAFSAVCRFLERWDPRSAAEDPVLKELGGGFSVFQIRGETRYVHEVPEIVSWWDAQVAATDPAPSGQCLVTGDVSPIARLHPKIKGVSGAQPSGATIAGFNDDAYCSYGLSQSFNAPVSEDAAHRYTNALNALLDGPRRDKHRVVVGGTTVAFWTDRPSVTEDVFAIFLGEGSSPAEDAASQDPVLRAKLEAFLAALRSGKDVHGDVAVDPPGTGYFIVGLGAPTPARIAVRFAHRSTISQLLASLRGHHQDIGVQRQRGPGSKHPDPEFPPIWLLVRQAGREAGDVPANLAPALLKSIVTGSRYPQALFTAVIRRILADRTVNYARACVIKGSLVRNYNMEVPVSLDTSRSEPAYRLGRLFAALEKTQQDALGSVGAGIRDRFYASASATPGTVFPRLLRTYQHHLAKLEGGRKVNREKLVQEIFAALNAIPAHLGLPEQGMFALGYYHQMNDFFQKKDEPQSTTAA